TPTTIDVIRINDLRLFLNMLRQAILLIIFYKLQAPSYKQTQSSNLQLQNQKAGSFSFLILCF
ncbi:MAG: hypothetical protein B7Z63_06005, partial [Ignavibacteriae bacterium 37-53-5]